jgi:hypothetical protein
MKEMNSNTIRILTRFGAETRFELAPVPAVPFRGTLESALDRLKERLLRERLIETTNTEFYAPLRRAANEAAALAWLTPYPMLVFPLLFEEKTAAARMHMAKQERIRLRSHNILAEAA